MSVIAKMSIQKISEYGTGSHIDLSCVAQNDLMAMYAGSEEDKLFTQASPWGEMSLNQPRGFAIGKQGDQFYVMILRDSEAGDKNFPDAYASCKARCISLTDFGGTSRRVEFCDHTHKAYSDSIKSVRIEGLNWKMTVDNPPAFAQFEPGKTDYWIAFYPASSFDRNKAIAAAHG
jgi:hypothetical protein